MNASIFNQSLNLRTKAQVDQAARELSEFWGMSFEPAPKFDGKKKDKLRDIVCRMSNYKNGYKSFLAWLEKHKIPTTSEQFDLPDTLAIRVCPWDFEEEDMVVGTKPKDISYLNSEDENCLYLLVSEDNVEDGLVHQYGSLKQTPLWQYICEHYVADALNVYMPSIDEYGLIDAASDEGGLDLVTSLYLEASEYFTVHPNDRGDDGTATAFIELKRRT